MIGKIYARIYDLDYWTFDLRMVLNANNQKLQIAQTY